MILFLLIVYLTLSHVSVLNSLDISAETIIGETNKMKQAGEIFKSIKDSDFVKTVKEVSKWGLPLLQALNSFAKVIMGFFKSDSKELTYMKEQFEIINNKMDVVDQEFENIKRLMDWNVIKIQYSKYEMAINVIQEKIQYLMVSNVAIKEMNSAEFIRTYDQLYQNAAENIYNSFVNSNAIFSDNLIVAIRKYTKNYPSKIEQFFMGNIKLIFKALEVETFYLNLKNYTGIEDHWQSKWDQNFKTLTKVMTETVEGIKNNWGNQWKGDVEEYNVENQQKSQEDYAEGLYYFLNDKFRNRIWLTLVYDPLDSERDHAFELCDGISQMQHRGHNILISSVEKAIRPINQVYYKGICSVLPTFLPISIMEPAKNLLQNHIAKYYSCGNIKFVALIRSKSIKVLKGPEDHVATCRWSGYYNKFVNIHKTLDLVIMG